MSMQSLACRVPIDVLALIAEFVDAATFSASPTLVHLLVATCHRHVPTPFVPHAIARRWKRYDQGKLHARTRFKLPTGVIARIELRFYFVVVEVRYTEEQTRSSPQLILLSLLDQMASRAANAVYSTSHPRLAPTDTTSIRLVLSHFRLSAYDSHWAQYETGVNPARMRSIDTCRDCESNLDLVAGKVAAPVVFLLGWVHTSKQKRALNISLQLMGMEQLQGGEDKKR